jgi:hypothetical protein
MHVSDRLDVPWWAAQSHGLTSLRGLAQAWTHWSLIRVEEKTIVVYLLHSRDLRHPATNAHKAPLMHPNRFILLPRLVASTPKSTITLVHKRSVAAE